MWLLELRLQQQQANAPRVSCDSFRHLRSPIGSSYVLCTLELLFHGTVNDVTELSVCYSHLP